MSIGFDFTVPETVDLSDPDRQLTDVETSDVIHRAGYPRSAVATELDMGARGVMTRGATDIADARCGVPPDHEGPHPNRGTLRWYRHYIARLDEFADEMVPDWRLRSHNYLPYPWCDTAFGPVTWYGRTAPSPNDSRNPDHPRAVGHWTFAMPPARH